MLNSKFFKTFLFGLLVAISFSGCTKVNSGFVGVKVNLLGSDKGVEVETLGVGRYWIGMNEELHLFPTFTQNYVWTKDPTEGSENDESINFQTVEGLNVNGDFGISYHILPEKAATVFQKYRRGVDEITDLYLRNIVRDSLVETASKMPVEAIYGEGKEALMSTVNKVVSDRVKDIGIEIESVYMVGNFRLPVEIEKSINMKIAATQAAQQRENDLRTAEAQSKIIQANAEGESKSKIIHSTADAKANDLLSQSLTPQLVEYNAILRWDGKLPLVTSGSSNGNMILDLSKIMEKKVTDETLEVAK